MESAAALRTFDAAAEAQLAALVCSPSRLEVVERVQLLDAPAHESFDALTRLAALLLKTPASFFSVVDATRDFYVSQQGFSEPLASTRELSGRTFCHHALARHEPLVIDDTHASPAWAAVPTVTTLGVRAYVGVPLRIDGETIGSFCVIDTQPRHWTADEVEILGQLAMSAAREIQLRSLLRKAKVDAERMQALARKGEELNAVIAHDLRSPLQVLGLSAMLLQRSASPAPPEVVQRMLGAIDAMKRLADDLVATSASVMPSGAARQGIGVAKLLGDVVDTLAPVAARAQMNLALGNVEDAQVSVDYAQMLRVFGNLIGNSIKYCPPGSAISVEAGRQGQDVLLRVTDDGPGIGAEALKRVFERGWQGGDGLVRNDGAGLGLTIVRTLVEQHGGRVELSSELGRGTTCTVCLAAS